MSAPDSARCARAGCGKPQTDHRGGWYCWGYDAPLSMQGECFVAPVETAPRTASIGQIMLVGNPQTCPHCGGDSISVPSEGDCWFDAGNALVLQCDRCKQQFAEVEAPAVATPQPVVTEEGRTNYVQAVPNSKRPYLYAGQCHACGRVATPDTPLVATQPVSDSVGITPDTRWCCLHGCATPVDSGEPTRKGGLPQTVPLPEPRGYTVQDVHDECNRLARMVHERDAQLATLTARLQALEAAARQYLKLKDELAGQVGKTTPFDHEITRQILDECKAADTALRSLTPTTQDHDGR